MKNKCWAKSHVQANHVFKQINLHIKTIQLLRLAKGKKEIAPHQFLYTAVMQREEMLNRVLITKTIFFGHWSLLG